MVNESSGIRLTPERREATVVVEIAFYGRMETSDNQVWLECGEHGRHRVYAKNGNLVMVRLPFRAGRVGSPAAFRVVLVDETEERGGMFACYTVMEVKAP